MEKGYQGFKFEDGTFRKVTDQIVPERALQISIDGESFTITMHSPGDEELLGFGLLYSEGMLSKFNKNIFEFIRNELNEVVEVNFKLKVQKEEFINKRSLLSVSSCGICGQTELNLPEGHLSDGFNISPKRIFKSFRIMQKQQASFVHTGGSHAAAIFNGSGDLIACKEDVGRHNAVDKAVGFTLKKELLHEAKLLLVSGRISYEILVKCFKAKIPVLAAVSTPSSLSIDFAKELGITLIGFCRENKLTVYSGVERLEGIA